MLYALLAGLCVLLLVGGYAVRQKQRPTPAESPRLTPDQLALVIDPTAERDRLNPRPRAPEQTEADCWIPADQPVTVGGIRLTRGLVYVGAGLYRDRRAWKPYDFLLDPTRKVNATAPDHSGRTVPLWPAYHKLAPDARAALLTWLADGADRPEVPEGFVLLYLAGLAHRLHEDDAVDDADAVRAEVLRLQAVYGDRPMVAARLAQVLAT